MTINTYAQINDSTLKHAGADIKLTGVDAEKGVAMCGGTAGNYKKALAVFRKDAHKKIGEVEGALANNNLPLYTVYVHALKSATANIGALELNETAKELEIAGKRGYRTYIDEHTQPFLEKLKSLISEIADIIAEDGEPEGAIDFSSVKNTSGRKTIFLVDDDQTSLVVGKMTLAPDYNVVTMASAAQLLDELEKNIPDLILLDIAMPETNGYQAIKKLKSTPRTASIPVIFLTAKSTDESELQGLSLGAVDYITKPFSAPRLLKRIEVHLLVETQKHTLEIQARELHAQKQQLAEFNAELQNMVDVRTNTVIELRDALLRTMAELVECRDDITGGHIERTQNYLGALLTAMLRHNVYRDEVESWDIKLVLQSAQLHDVGKISIKDSILNKPGKLTPEEFEEMKKHTTFGGIVIQKISESTSERKFLEYAMIFAVTHHEKWDGSGYPEGLKGEEIPLLGRLMAIADVYDALRSDRPYKKAFSHEEAVRIILEGRGSHFDPALVDLFMKISDEFDRISTTMRAGST